MEPPNSDFADLVKRLREARLWSRSELARRSGLTQAEISRLEASKRMPTIRHVKHLAGIFSETRMPGDPDTYAGWVAMMVDLGDEVRKENRAARRSG
tara:strand:+ start:359 stop:649 length:291 start_codon:yes stop_codon:yes gene_type:complete